MSTISEYIIRIMVDTFSVPVEEAGLDAEFEDLQLDSLVLAELAVLLKKEYGIDVPYEDLEDARTIGNAATLVETAMAARDARAVAAAS